MQARIWPGAPHALGKPALGVESGIGGKVGTSATRVTSHRPPNRQQTPHQAAAPSTAVSASGGAPRGQRLESAKEMLQAPSVGFDDPRASRSAAPRDGLHGVQNTAQRAGPLGFQRELRPHIVTGMGAETAAVSESADMTDS